MATGGLGTVVLVTGKEEFLAERLAAEIKRSVLAVDAEAEVSDLDASTLNAGIWGELGSASLFSSTRVVVVRALENIGDEAVDGLLALAAEPPEDVALVVLHGGGNKGSGVVNKLRKLAAVTETKVDELKGGDLVTFVMSEVKSQGGRIDSETAAALVQAVGQDLRSLAAACSQLVSDVAEPSITGEHVKQYFGGRAEASSFAVADAAFAGQRAKALEELRWALDNGTAPVLVSSALASGARSLARLSGMGRGARDADIARDVGVPPWKIRTLREQLRGWSEAKLAEALRAVASTDADIKGAGADPAYSLERLVLTVTSLRNPRD